MIGRTLNIKPLSKSTGKESMSLHLERRRCARTTVAVPVSCVSVDAAEKPLDQNKGIIKNVSQTGIRIEAEHDACSDRLKLAVVDLDKRIAEINAKLVSSKKKPCGTYKLGVKLQGHKLDIIRFVSRLVRHHHYTKKMD